LLPFQNPLGKFFNHSTRQSRAFNSANPLFSFQQAHDAGPMLTAGFQGGKKGAKPPFCVPSRR
jgi:hypothetical protein